MVERDENQLQGTKLYSTHISPQGSLYMLELDILRPHGKVSVINHSSYVKAVF